MGVNLCVEAGYWNIKGCGDVARVFGGNFLVFRKKRCGDFCLRCATNVPPLIDPRFSTLQDREMEEIHGHQAKNGTKSPVSE